MTQDALVEAEAVGQRFGDLAVLEAVDLTVGAAQSVAIVGPSGSGKSTLLNILGGLMPPTSGRIRVAGHDLTGLAATELAAFRNREVGFVFQSHHLLPQCSAIENVLVPTLVAERAGDDPAARAEALLERVGLADRMHHRPSALSGGECQRVAVVRALINRPRVLLADEPTGSLDAAAAKRLGELLVELNTQEDTALVAVTHAPALAACMQRTLELRNGRLQERE